MAKGWRNESRRHSLAAKGVKTAVDNKPFVSVDRFSGVGDENVPVDEVIVEIEPILDFLQARVSDRKEEATVSLDVSFKDFNKYHPEISRKDLIKLFDHLDTKRRETYYALEQLKKERKRPQTIIKSIFI